MQTGQGTGDIGTLDDAHLSLVLKNSKQMQLDDCFVFKYVQKD